MNQPSLSYVPISVVAEELEVERETLYYYFTTNKEDAKKYLKVRYSDTGSGGKKKRYYVRTDFAAHYLAASGRSCSTEDIAQYEELYREYIIKEEAKIEEQGKSQATEDALWKDMELVDPKLSRACLKELKRQTGKKKITSNERGKIADIVYRQMYSKRQYLLVCIDTLRAELAK